MKKSNNLNNPVECTENGAVVGGVQETENAMNIPQGERYRYKVETIDYDSDYHGDDPWVYLEQELDKMTSRGERIVSVQNLYNGDSSYEPNAVCGFRVVYELPFKDEIITDEEDSDYEETCQYEFLDRLKTLMKTYNAEIGMVDVFINKKFVGHSLRARLKDINAWIDFDSDKIDIHTVEDAIENGVM